MRVVSPLENWRVSEQRLLAVEQRISKLTPIGQNAAPCLPSDLATLLKAWDAARQSSDKWWALHIQDADHKADEGAAGFDQGLAANIDALAVRDAVGAETGPDQPAAASLVVMLKVGLMADQGHTEAMLDLGIAYSRGEGVPQDYAMAHMWFNLAAARGNSEARAQREMMEGKMSKDQVAEAQRLAREWKPKPER